MLMVQGPPRKNNSSVADSVALKISMSDLLGYNDVDDPETTIEEHLCGSQRKKKGKCLETPLLMSGPQMLPPGLRGTPQPPTARREAAF